MNNSSVAEFTRMVGKSRAFFDKKSLDAYSQNVCGIQREIKGVLFPRSSKEIQEIVRFARKNKTPLYPISTGKNWGLGAKLPVRDGHLVLDLSKMNRILSFDSRAGVLTIEPGVTQGQIADYLKTKHARYVLNVTGSSNDSSVIGNALERGVAHYGCRVSEVLSLNVVLGTGETLIAGGGVVVGSRTKSFYPYGIGPDLRGLFFQSGFGIVTEAVIQLMPKKETVGVVTLEKHPNISLRQFVDGLFELNRKGLIPPNLHISNLSRRLSVVTPLYAREMNISLEEAEKEVKKLIKSDWAATCSFSGSRSHIRNAFEDIKVSVGNISTISLLLKEDMLKGTSPLRKATRGVFLHSCGVPSDDAIYSLGYAQKEKILSNPVDSQTGTLFVVPLLPFRGRDLAKVYQIVHRNFQAAGFEIFATFNLVEALNLEGVINLTFSRDNQSDVARAHSCIEKTFDDLIRCGYFPQRMGVFQMSRLLGMETSHTGMIQSLKNFFDPDHILSQGRYGTT